MIDNNIYCELIQASVEPFRQFESIGDHSACVFVLNTDHFLNKIDRYTSLLNNSELDAFYKMAKESDVHHKIIVRAVLKLLLSTLLDQTAQSIEILKDGFGKPYCSAAFSRNIHFNVADSKSMVLISIATDTIGIDLEHINPDFEFGDIVQEHFHENEKLSLLNAPDPLLFFYLFWTRKEAILKLSGRGLDDYLSFLDMTDGKKKVKLPHADSSMSSLVSSFKIDSSLIGSLAVPPTIKELRFFNYIASDIE